MPRKPRKGQPKGSPLVQYRLKPFLMDKLNRIARANGYSGSELAKRRLEQWLMRQPDSNSDAPSSA